MSSRPSDWSPLDRWSDPTPGDPDHVRRAGRHYRDVADAIDVAVRRLRELTAHEDMQSKAVTAFVGIADDVANDIAQAKERYAGVGDALTVYAPLHADAQDLADDALRRASAAEDDIRSASSRLDSARDAADDNQRRADGGDTAAGSDQHLYNQAVTRAQGDLDDAESALRTARTDADRAERDFKSAAKAARDKIDDVMSMTTSLDDSLGDDFKGLVKAIANIAGLVAAIAGILALAVGWIPVIGQALAAVLGAIALVAGIISLVCNLGLALTGNGSWSAVILDVIGVATFGIGRAVVGAARGTFAAVRGLARMNAGTIAAMSRASRIQLGISPSVARLGSRGLMNNLLGNGNAALVRMSRSGAADLVTDARRIPFLSRGHFLDDFTEMGSNLSTLFNRGNWAQGLGDIPDALRAMGRSGSPTEFLAHLTQNGDLLAHADFTSGLDDLVRTGDMFTRAGRLTFVSGGATAVAAGLDTFQSFQGLSGILENPLNLPSDPMPAR